MAFRPLLSVPKPLALTVGAASFFILYAMSNSLLPSTSPAASVSIFVAIFVVAGGIAGFIAGQSPLMHGALLGALTGLIAISYVAIVDGAGFAGLGSFLESVVPVAVYMAIPGIALCSLGAVLGDYLQGRVRAGGRS